MYQVVCITAKIHFLKQFTTCREYKVNWQVLFVLLQRYTFWSNSQHILVIHHIVYVVCITAKIHFLKQFTTDVYNSVFAVCCLYYCKDTLFEAIHNIIFFTLSYIGLFVLLQRYTFWSNSQRQIVVAFLIPCCLYYCKDTLFEAIHNRSSLRTMRA